MRLRMVYIFCVCTIACLTVMHVHSIWVNLCYFLNAKFALKSKVLVYLARCYACFLLRSVCCYFICAEFRFSIGFCWFVHFGMRREDEDEDEVVFCGISFGLIINAKWSFWLIYEIRQRFIRLFTYSFRFLQFMRPKVMFAHSQLRFWSS